MTMPRTKITPSTPLEQRVALNRLKQRLFDDAADKEQDNKKVSFYSNLMKYIVVKQIKHSVLSSASETLDFFHLKEVG